MHRCYDIFTGLFSLLLTLPSLPSLPPSLPPPRLDCPLPRVRRLDAPHHCRLQRLPRRPPLPPCPYLVLPPFLLLLLLLFLLLAGGAGREGRRGVVVGGCPQQARGRSSAVGSRSGFPAGQRRGQDGARYVKEGRKEGGREGKREGRWA